MNIDATKQKILLGIIGAFVLVVFISAAINLGKAPKKPQEEATQAANYEEDENSSGLKRNTGFTNSRNLPTASKSHMSSSKNMTNLSGFTEDKNGDLFRAAGSSKIYGTVFGKEGTPLSGAEVFMLPFPLGNNPTVLRTVKSDQNGSYTLENINDSDMQYTVIAKANGFAPARRNTMLRQEPVKLDINMKEGRTIKGLVRDVSTSAPLEGAHVFLPDYYPATETTTTAEGTFSFDNMPQEPMRVAAEKEGYPPKSTMVGLENRVRRGENNEQNPQRMQQMMQRFMPPNMEQFLSFDSNNVVINMTPGGATVRGTVVDNAGKPIAGAKVKVATTTPNFIMQLAYPAMQRTGMATKEDGLFEVKGLPADTELALTAQKGMEGPPVKLTLKPNEVKENVRLQAPSPLLVSGRVIYASSSRPVAGASVGYDTPAGQKNVLADDNGEFMFQTMAIENKYKIYVEAPCLAPADGEKSTTEVAKFIEREVPKNSGSDNVTIRMKSTAAFLGTITDSNGQPAKFITVRAAHQTETGVINTSAQTDFRGQYYFNMPDQSKGQTSIIYARSNRGVAMKTAKRSAKRTRVDLKIENTRVRGSLLLSDYSTLDGVSINMSYVDAKSGIRFDAETVNTGINGRFTAPIEKDSDITMTFLLPDGQTIEQLFDSDKIADTQTSFIYDPVGKTITNRSGGQSNRGGNRQNKQGNRGEVPRRTN